MTSGCFPGKMFKTEAKRQSFGVQLTHTPYFQN